VSPGPGQWFQGSFPDGAWSLVLARACQLAQGEEGQDVVEYGLMIATIVIVVLLAIGAFGTQIETWFNTLAARITTTGTA
jgi:Flp pilus assembly pilin Flp